MSEHASQYSVVPSIWTTRMQEEKGLACTQMLTTAHIPPGDLHPSLTSSQTSAPAKPIYSQAYECVSSSSTSGFSLLIVSTRPAFSHLGSIHPDHSRPTARPSSFKKPSLTCSPNFQS